MYFTLMNIAYALAVFFGLVTIGTGIMGLFRHPEFWKSTLLLLAAGGLLVAHGLTGDSWMLMVAVIFVIAWGMYRPGPMAMQIWRDTKKRKGQ